ncbi:hypothetical protein GQ43DRAFT_444382 [Delitschia confertaspora ATCC 74209]|uniref:Uncharacterized protein n=1 Tax=Delitschia confertaspora ATCC 74209 TaxID=1513339 RepID=A0A9P4MUR9_9PLEO|nr:hypothetical protein GQ43DRAFT_444382 [Delitschia confertaspora ATCC 74209]
MDRNRTEEIQAKLKDFNPETVMETLLTHAGEIKTVKCDIQSVQGRLRSFDLRKIEEATQTHTSDVKQLFGDLRVAMSEVENQTLEMERNLTLEKLATEDKFRDLDQKFRGFDPKLVENMVRANVSAISNANSKIHNLQDEVIHVGNRLSRDVGEATGGIELVLSEIQTVKERLGDVDPKLMQATVRKNASNIETAMSQIQAVRAKIQDFDPKSLHERINTLTTQLQTETTERQSHESRFHRFDPQVAIRVAHTNTRDIETAKDDIQALQGKFHRLGGSNLTTTPAVEKIEQLTRDVENMRRSLDAATWKDGQLQRKVEKLEQELETEKKTRLKLEGSHAKMGDVIVEFNQTLAALENRTQALESLRESERKKNQSLQARVDELEASMYLRPSKASLEDRINTPLGSRISTSLEDRIDTSLESRISYSLDDRINTSLEDRINTSLESRMDNSLENRITTLDREHESDWKRNNTSKIDNDEPLQIKGIARANSDAISGLQSGLAYLENWMESLEEMHMTEKQRVGALEDRIGDFDPLQIKDIVRTNSTTLSRLQFNLEMSCASIGSLKHEFSERGKQLEEIDRNMKSLQGLAEHHSELSRRISEAESAAQDTKTSFECNAQDMKAALLTLAQNTTKSLEAYKEELANQRSSLTHIEIKASLFNDSLNDTKTSLVGLKDNLNEQASSLSTIGNDISAMNNDIQELEQNVARDIRPGLEDHGKTHLLAHVESLEKSAAIGKKSMQEAKFKIMNAINEAAKKAKLDFQAGKLSALKEIDTRKHQIAAEIAKAAEQWQARKADRFEGVDSRLTSNRPASMIPPGDAETAALEAQQEHVRALEERYQRLVEQSRRGPNQPEGVSTDKAGEMDRNTNIGMQLDPTPQEDRTQAVIPFTTKQESGNRQRQVVPNLMMQTYQAAAPPGDPMAAPQKPEDGPEAAPVPLYQHTINNYNYNHSPQQENFTYSGPTTATFNTAFHQQAPADPPHAHRAEFESLFIPGDARHGPEESESLFIPEGLPRPRGHAPLPLQQDAFQVEHTCPTSVSRPPLPESHSVPGPLRPIQPDEKPTSFESPYRPVQSVGRAGAPKESPQSPRERRQPGPLHVETRFYGSFRGPCGELLDPHITFDTPKESGPFLGSRGKLPSPHTATPNEPQSGSRSELFSKSISRNPSPIRPGPSPTHQVLSLKPHGSSAESPTGRQNTGYSPANRSPQQAPLSRSGGPSTSNGLRNTSPLTPTEQRRSGGAKVPVSNMEVWSRNPRGSRKPNGNRDWNGGR